MNIAKIRAINYDTRTGVIDPLAWPTPEDMEDNIMVLNAEYDIEVLDPITGWREYTHQIPAASERV